MEAFIDSAAVWRTGAGRLAHLMEAALLRSIINQRCRAIEDGTRMRGPGRLHCPTRNRALIWPHICFACRPMVV
jgi:hypothetical protein